MMTRSAFSALGLVLLGFVAMLPTSVPAYGTRLTEAQAASISGGGCVNYPATTSCTLDARCAVVNGEQYSTEAGNETFDTSTPCCTYMGNSCGVYATSKTCSGE